MPSRKLEDRIEQLRHLRSGTPGPDVDALLQKALADRSNLVIAEAARTVGELRLSGCISSLLAAFDRLFESAVKSDPKCWGKTAIVKALAQLDYSESPPFVRGSRHVQMEPVYGGREDSAPQLRANCVLAFVQCSDLTRFEVLRHLVDAMTDPADPVRIEAVRALNQLGGDESLLLLRLKARLGDRRPLIIGHVFDALLNMERDRAVPFVAEYLNSTDEELRDEAALALGGSRLSSALRVLTEAWDERSECKPDRAQPSRDERSECKPDAKRKRDSAQPQERAQPSRDERSEAFSDVILRAISSSRLPEAIEFLLDLLRTGTPRQSAAAAEALKLHEGSAEIQALIDRARRDRRQDI